MEKMRNLLKNRFAQGLLILFFPLILVFGVIALIVILISIGIISLIMGFGVVLGLIIMAVGVIMIFAKLIKIGLVFVIIGIIFIFLTCYGIIDLSFINIGVIKSLGLLRLFRL